MSGKNRGLLSTVSRLDRKLPSPMNPVTIVLFCAALLTIFISLPLIRGKVKMNDWYGVRIPAAFESDAAWYELNRYGGRLLVVWGLGIAFLALIGGFLPRSAWIAFNWGSLVIIMGGLAAVVALVYRHARTKPW